jgi:iron complex transport system substrate-binding protein
MPRIASLLPATTEIVCALGMRDALVARSHECDFPAGVRSLPVITSARLDSAKPSGAIDADVRALIGQALSIYEVDAEALKRLRPDVLLTQSRCEVCAVTVADVERALAAWQGEDMRPRVISLAPGALESVFRDVLRVAEALGVPERGKTVVQGLRRRTEAIASRAEAPRPSVLCMEWIEPPMGAGYWVPELVRMAGGRIVVGEPGGTSPWLTWARMHALDPDVLVVMPCGFDFPRTRDELSAQRKSGNWDVTWGRLRAVREGRVFVADGNQYFNRPGPRLVESLEILAEVLHPERFAFGHEGTGWVRWEA